MTENYEEFLYITLLPALAVYLIYIILSTYLFLRSGGLGELYFNFIFPLFWLILVIARFFTASSYLTKYYFFGILILIFIFQIFSVLFNVKTCWGRSRNSYNYIQEIIAENPESLCEKDTAIEPWVAFNDYIWIRLSYYFLNLILIVSLVAANENFG